MHFFAPMLLRLRKIFGSRILLHCRRTSKNYFLMGMLSLARVREKMRGNVGLSVSASALND
jgi:hypothetical protein